MTLDELGVVNDMYWGWISEAKWHESLYYRWKHMWKRCKDPSNKEYNSYKDCEIDERYRKLSNYINDIKSLENFDKLCENPSKWSIDKDIKGGKDYYINNLSIISIKDNIKERNTRRGNPNPPIPIIGINIDDNTILIFKSLNSAKEKGFHPGLIKKYISTGQTYKRYKWFYLDRINENN